MNESEFHREVDAVLARVERPWRRVDTLDSTSKPASSPSPAADGTRVIVNRQTPNREIWVAARSGGFHFTFRDGAWRDTRSGDELYGSLARRIAALQAGDESRSVDVKRSARTRPKPSPKGSRRQMVSSRYDYSARKNP